MKTKSEQRYLDVLDRYGIDVEELSDRLGISVSMARNTMIRKLPIKYAKELASQLNIDWRIMYDDIQNSQPLADRFDTPMSVFLANNGVTLVELAKALGVKRSVARMYALQYKLIPKNRYASCSKALGIDIDDFTEVVQYLKPRQTKLAKVMKVKNINGQQLADMIGKSKMWVSKMKSGAFRLTEETVNELAEKLEVRPEDIREE